MEKFQPKILPVDKLTLVKIVKSFNNAGDVETSDIIVERSFCVKSSPQITSHVGIGEQVDEFFILGPGIT